MTSKNLIKGAATAILAFATLISAPSFAQTASAQVAEPERTRSNILPCCNCLNEVKTAGFNTGNAVWTVKLPSAAIVGTSNASNAAWTTTTIPAATWISPAGNPQTQGNYVYQTTVDTRNCTLGSTVTISGRFLADNVGSVLVDGKPIVSSAGTPNYGFLPGSLTSFSYTAPSGGVHTITINAYNAGGPTGIIAEVTATRTCRGNPERDRRADAAGPRSATLAASALEVPCTNC